MKSLHRFAFMFALAMLVIAPCVANAALITSVGTDQDLGGLTARSPWRSAATAKSFDADGNNVLGSDGYFVVGNNQRTFVPGYAANFTSIGGTFGGNGSYAAIDDPVTTPGGSPTTILSGTKNPFPGTNNHAAVYAFDVLASVPSTFRLGVMIDNLDASGFNPNGLRVVQTVGGAGDSGLIATTAPAFFNRIPDWVFFDISGAAAGDRFEVRPAGGPNGCACAGAFSFDSVGGPFPLADPSAIWNVDIAGTGSPQLAVGTIAYDAGGGVWNDFRVAHHSGTSVNPTMSLVDSTGTASPVAFSIIGTVSGFNASAANDLIEDYLFVQAGNADPDIDFEISGLIPGATYEFIAYGAVSRTISILIDQTGEMGVANFNGRLFANIVADVDGKITGTAGAATTVEENLSGFQLRLVSTPPPTVPEPATAAMGLMSVVLLAMRRRRSTR